MNSGLFNMTYFPQKNADKDSVTKFPFAYNCFVGLRLFKMLVRWLSA